LADFVKAVPSCSRGHFICFLSFAVGIICWLGPEYCRLLLDAIRHCHVVGFVLLSLFLSGVYHRVYTHVFEPVCTAPAA
jgi:hypothetical protein